MNNNVRIASELVRMAKNLVARDEMTPQLQEELDKAEREGKKYILLYAKYVWRIMACKDFGNVKKGDLGGFVKSEENLSHEGNCWIYGDALVSGNAKVSDNAEVSGDAKVDCEVYEEDVTE